MPNPESGGFIHADLKPENVQFERINHDKLRIIDFGSAEPRNKEGKTRDICTDQYRAPEVILRSSDKSDKHVPFYSSKVDVWSAGCIIYDRVAIRV